MSVNKDKPHVLILPEDSANRQLATGFLLEVDLTRQRQMQVLVEAGGWHHVPHLFKSEYVKGIESYPARFMILLIDFDNDAERLNKARDVIPDHLNDRVFVLGVLSEPEDLKTALGSYETVGSKLAQDCREETYATWNHELLQHNESELDRLRERVRSILF